MPIIYFAIVAACATSGLIVWAVCALYWSGHYADGLIDGRAEALESRIAENRQLVNTYPPRQTAAGVNLKIATQSNVVDLAAWRQWAERPSDPLPDAPTMALAPVIPVPAIGTNEVDAWIDKVLAQISERIYGP